MRQLNSRLRRSIFVLGFVIWFGCGHAIHAQAPGLPDGMEAPPNMQPPKLNLDREIGRMTKRYALSNAQKTHIRLVLEEEQHKLEAVFHDSSLAPEERFSKVRAIREEQVSRGCREHA